MRIKDYLDLIYFQRPRTLKVSEIQKMEITSINPSVIMTRPNHDDGPWSQHIIPAPNQVGVRHLMRDPLDLNATNIILGRKYDGPLDLTEAKKNDIRQMLPFLAPEHVQFYQDFV